MYTEFTTHGQLLPNGTIDLSAAPPFPSGPVEVTVRALPKSEKRIENGWAYLLRARAELEALGKKFMTEEEVRAHVEDLRRDWDDPRDQDGK